MPPERVVAQDTPTRPAPQRSRAGCLTCRRRKVKCDETRPSCEKCGIKKRQCIWADGDVGDIRSRSVEPYPRPSTSQSVKHVSLSPTSQIKLPHQPPSLASIGLGGGGGGVGSISVQTYSTHPTPPFSLSPIQSHHPPPNPASTSPHQSLLIDAAASLFNLHGQGPTPTTTSTTIDTRPVDPGGSSLVTPQDLDLTFNFFPHVPLVTPQKAGFYVPPDFLPPEAFTHPKFDAIEISPIPQEKQAQLMADPAFLRPYFPSVEERLVIRHYLLETVHIIVAYESPRRRWNPWIMIHAPLAFNHLPGTNHAADALRSAMLAVGAVHLRYTSNPKDRQSAWRVVHTAKSKVLRLVRQAVEKTGRLEEEEVELILAALLSCTIASSLAADNSWRELLTSVMAFVDRLGGAEALMKGGDQTRMSSFRFFLEQLATRDVFGCMITELPPSILSTAFSPWFFEAEAWSRGDDEWESVERMFGISRGMVDVLARSCALVHKVRQRGVTLSETRLSEPAWPGGETIPMLRLAPRAIERLNKSRTDPSSGGASGGAGGDADAELDALIAEANGLTAELRIWDAGANFSPLHLRCQYGNHSYRHATRIRLLREVFGVPIDDPRVQASVAAIIEVGVELLVRFGRITWLTWPIVIAAFNMLPGDPSRQTAILLLGEFGFHASFDVEMACRMLNELWKPENAAVQVTPAQIANRLRSQPFLD